LTADGFESLINANYSELRSIYGQSPYLFCAGTDLYSEGQGRGSEPLGLSQYTELNPSSQDVDQIYTAAYKAIRQANTAIYYADLTEQTGDISQRLFFVGADLWWSSIDY